MSVSEQVFHLGNVYMLMMYCTICSPFVKQKISNWRLYRNSTLPIFYRNISKNLCSLSCIAATISSLKSAFGTRRELVLLALIAVLAVCSLDALLQNFSQIIMSDWLPECPPVSRISPVLNNLISQPLTSPQTETESHHTIL